MRRSLVVLLLATGLGAVPGDAPEPRRWGSQGHEMAARAAAEALPSEMPAFFRDAVDQLVYLNPEPDRWRDREQREMDQAFAYDHYIDLENVPKPALEARDRFEYLAALYTARLPKPERDAGFLPFRITELYQRLVAEWRLWREADGARRAFVEERVIADAGILGHYVTDASNPHHTTIHFNGWNEQAPNPENYTYDRRFHYRFEAAFVGAHVDQAAVSGRLTGPAHRVGSDIRGAVMDHIFEAHAEVETLYRLDRDVGFDPEGPAPPELVDFAAERLASGADMLRALWWSAWLESADR